LSGVSGSGKSSLAVDTLYAERAASLRRELQSVCAAIPRTARAAADGRARTRCRGHFRRPASPGEEFPDRRSPTMSRRRGLPFRAFYPRGRARLPDVRQCRRSEPIRGPAATRARRDPQWRCCRCDVSGPRWRDRRISHRSRAARRRRIPPALVAGEALDLDQIRTERSDGRRRRARGGGRPGQSAPRTSAPGSKKPSNRHGGGVMGPRLFSRMERRARYAKGSFALRARGRSTRRERAFFRINLPRRLPFVPRFRAHDWNRLETRSFPTKRCRSKRALSARGRASRADGGAQRCSGQFAKRSSIATNVAWRALSAKQRAMIIDVEGSWRGGKYPDYALGFQWLETRTYKMHACACSSRVTARTIRARRAGVSDSIPMRSAIAWAGSIWRRGTDSKLSDANQRLAALRSRTAQGELVRRELSARLGYLERVGLGYPHARSIGAHGCREAKRSAYR